jgi:hypothetical protein
MNNSKAEKLDKFKALLQMLYGNVSSAVYKNVVTYQCYDVVVDDFDDTKHIDIKLIAFNTLGTDNLTEYKDVNNYTKHKNIGVIELKDKTVIIYDIPKQEEIARYTDIGKVLHIEDSAILMIMKHRLILYSFLEMKETFNNECVSRQNIAFSHRVKGIKYDICNMRASIIITDKQGNIAKFIEGTEESNFTAIRYKKQYCDLVMINYEKDKTSINGEVGVSENSQFIHEDKIFTLEEYLRYLTITEIKRVNAPDKRIEFKGVEKIIKIIDHYDIITDKGYKGTLTTDLLEMHLEDVCNNENLLTENFESIREQYLV